MAQPTSYSWPVIGAAPFISNIRPIDSTTIDVTFNEDIVLAEALNSANYSFTGGLTVVSVTNVSGSSQVFRVTTSTQTAGASYTLTVSNVHNLTGQIV